MASVIFSGGGDAAYNQRRLFCFGCNAGEDEVEIIMI